MAWLTMLKEGKNNSLSNNAMPSKMILEKKKKTVRKLVTENIYSNWIVLEEMFISLLNWGKMSQRLSQIWKIDQNTPGRVNISFLKNWKFLSHVWLFVTPWTVAHQAPLSMEFSRQEYWSGLPCLSPGDLPHPGVEPVFLAFPTLAGRFFTTSATKY